MKILLKNRTRSLRLKNRPKLLEVLRIGATETGLEARCKTTAAGPMELHVILIGPRTMRRMNRQFLGHDYATDVLAFDLMPDPTSGLAEPPLAEAANRVAGEIYLCPAVAAEAAHHYNNTPAAELILYLIHGMLHLAGYGDKTTTEKRRMRGAERRVLQRLSDQHVNGQKMIVFDDAVEAENTLGKSGLA